MKMTRISRKFALENWVFTKDGKIAVNIDGLAFLLSVPREEIEQEIRWLRSELPNDEHPFPDAFYVDGQAYWCLYDVAEWFKNHPTVQDDQEVASMAASVLEKLSRPVDSESVKPIPSASESK